MSLTIWTFIVFAIYVLVLVAVSVIAMRRVRNSANADEQYYLGGRNIPTFVLAVSFQCSACSAGMMMGDPAMMGAVGWPYMWVVILAVICQPLAALLMIKRMHDNATQLGSLTVPEFLGSHYSSPKMSSYLSLMLAFFYIFTLCAHFKGAAGLLESFLGISFTTGLIIAIALATVMAVLGGLTSLSWTDLIQGVPMFAIVIVLLFVSLNAVDGFGGLETALNNIDPGMLNWVDASGSGGWATPLSLFGIFLFYFCTFCSQPYICTRFTALKDTKRGTMRSFLIAIMLIGAIGGAPYICGLVGRVLYGNTIAGDYYTTQLAIDLLPKPLAALFMVGVCSAIITTTTAILLTVGQTLGRDLWQRVFRPQASSKQLVNASRIFIVAVAVIIFLLNNFNPPAMLSSFLYMGMSGTGCALSAPMLCALFWPRATKKGAWACMITGPFIYMLLDLQNVVEMNYFVCCAAGIIVSFAVMIIVSLCTKDDHKLASA